MATQAIAEIQNRDELDQHLSRRLDDGESRHCAAVRNMHDQQTQLLILHLRDLKSSRLDTTRAQMKVSSQGVTRTTKIQFSYSNDVKKLLEKQIQRYNN